MNERDRNALRGTLVVTAVVIVVAALFVGSALSTWSYDVSNLIIATPQAGQDGITSNTALIYEFLSARTRYGSEEVWERRWKGTASTGTQTYPDGSTSTLARVAVHHWLRASNQTSYTVLIEFNTGKMMGVGDTIWNESSPTLTTAHYQFRLGPGPTYTTTIVTFPYEREFYGLSTGGSGHHGNASIFPIQNVGVLIVPDASAKTSATIQSEVTSGTLRFIGN